MRELSGGMKRRLQIAKALVHDPEIIILDEPTAGVDVELRHDLWLYLQELHKDGKTILLTTHYIDEAELLCERVGIIDKGKLIVEDTVSNLKKMVKNSSIEIQLKDNDNNDLSFLSEYDYKIDNNSLKIFTDTPNLELPSIILKFSEKDIKIEDIHIPQTSLEDVFLDLTGGKLMIKNWVGFYTLSSREIMRFFSVWRQTIIPGIVTTLLYIFVFGVALENRISEIGGVSYKIYILPGLLMMNVITNAVANSASSMLQMKLLQTLPELLITPLSSLELSLSFIIGGAIRGFVNGILILLICWLAGMPILNLPLHYFLFF